jgi:hypothetical protein
MRIGEVGDRESEAFKVCDYYRYTATSHSFNDFILRSKTMSIIRPFQATDLLRINNVNIDAWTETVSNGHGDRLLMGS